MMNKFIASLMLGILLVACGTASAQNVETELTVQEVIGPVVQCFPVLNNSCMVINEDLLESRTCEGLCKWGGSERWYGGCMSGRWNITGDYPGKCNCEYICDSNGNESKRIRSILSETKFTPTFQYYLNKTIPTPYPVETDIEQPIEIIEENDSNFVAGLPQRIEAVPISKLLTSKVSKPSEETLPSLKTEPVPPIGLRTNPIVQFFGWFVKTLFFWI